MESVVNLYSSLNNFHMTFLYSCSVLFVLRVWWSSWSPSSFDFILDGFLNLKSFTSVNNGRYGHKVLLIVHFNFHRVIDIVSFRIHRDWLSVGRLSGIIGVVVWRTILGALERNILRWIIAQRSERRRIVVGNGKLIETVTATITLVADRLHWLVRKILQNFW